MNPWQMAQQIRHRLATVTWPGGGDPVFGPRGVAVFAGTPTEEQIPAGWPWCLVGVSAGTPDADHPELIEQGYDLVAGVDVAGDPLGEFALIGGAAPSAQRSSGRGVLEVAERVRAAVGNLTGADGAKVLLSSTTTGALTALGRGRHMALDELSLTAICTSALHYVAPQMISHDGTVWRWAGAHCSARFDFVHFRLVRKTGPLPSADPADGTVIYTGDAAQFAGPVAAGYTYTAFADYGARGGSAAIDGSSDPEVGSYLTVLP
jgi:hypothetical protein